jgi:Gpi18-like mannosyltransferase
MILNMILKFNNYKVIISLLLETIQNNQNKTFHSNRIFYKNIFSFLTNQNWKIVLLKIILISI